MKKLLLSVALLTSAPAFAQYHGHHRPGGGGSGWLAPVIIGGVIGYSISQVRPTVVQQPPVIIQQPQVYSSPQVYSLPQAPYYGATPLYEKRTQYDPNCNCYVAVYNQYGWQ